MQFEMINEYISTYIEQDITQTGDLESIYLEKLSVFVSGFKKPVWNWSWNIFIEVICGNNDIY